MQHFFYRIFLWLYPSAIKVLSPFNEKAKLWITGRKDILEKLQQTITHDKPLIWMHCSSLGEFEQGRPLIERLRKLYPSYKLLLTFFSPSGYEVRKHYEGADYVFYMPMDSKENAAQFFDIVKPSLIIFIKYEFWNYYLQQAKAHQIPTLLISAIFRKGQPFFFKQGHFHRGMLACFTHLFVQNEESVSLLRSIGFTDNVSLTGDTRFDRVIEIAEGFQPVGQIEALCAAHPIIVAGSTWSEDDKDLAHYANSKGQLRFIIAPHNVAKDRLNECLKLYKNSILFSQAETQLTSATRTIIIDNIGMLSRLYKYATIAFVGGGFGEEGVHNVLEPAVYGKPVVFGPVYERYHEAVELVAAGGASSVENALELEAEFEMLLKDNATYDAMCKASKDYVYSRKGSTEQILHFIQAKRLLTS